ncbi:MAG: hypothetical protein AAFS06_23465, partial [Cyanobacteria bacterium J06631_12]
DTGDIGADVGESSIDLQQSISSLEEDIQRRLPFVSLTSETARREILIAPIMLAPIDNTQAQLRIDSGLTRKNLFFMGRFRQAMCGSLGDSFERRNA